MQILHNKCCVCLKPARHPHATYCFNHEKYTAKHGNNPAAPCSRNSGKATEPLKMYSGVQKIVEKV